MKINKSTVAALLAALALLSGCSLRPAPVEGAAAPKPEVPLETPAITPEPTPEPAVETTPEPTVEPTPEPTPEPAPTPEPTPFRPDIDVTSWEYILANASHPIGEYAPELVEVENGQRFDIRAADALRDFIQGARDQGLSVYLSSAYRGYDEQSYLYWRKVEQYGGDEATAATIVLPPGTSEHQTGLCADITDQYYAMKDASLENTAMFQWMNAHCEEYGFILRYPLGKGDITGVIYEPWHFRYVGKEAAVFIKENDLCLEEFLALYEDALPGAADPEA